MTKSLDKILTLSLSPQGRFAKRDCVRVQNLNYYFCKLIHNQD